MNVSVIRGQTSVAAFAAYDEQSIEIEQGIRQEGLALERREFFASLRRIGLAHNRAEPRQEFLSGVLFGKRVREILDGRLDRRRIKGAGGIRETERREKPK